MEQTKIPESDCIGGQHRLPPLGILLRSLREDRGRPTEGRLTTAPIVVFFRAFLSLSHLVEMGSIGCTLEAVKAVRNAA